MRHGVLTLAQKDRWNKYLSLMPGEFQDVYFDPDYYALYQTPTRQAQCFFVEEGEAIFLYPYLKTRINKITDFKLEKDFYDIEGAYGYNGFAVNRDDGFVRCCAGLFIRHCAQEGIVAEFMRLNPILPMPAADCWWDLKSLNTNVFVDLTIPPEGIWKDSYEHCVRKNVNKARQEGVSIKVFAGKDMTGCLLDEFIDIYYSTMERNASDAEYYFSKTYFQNVCAFLPEGCLFFFAYLNKEPVSCELVLKGKKTAYSFLGGTRIAAHLSRPNNLLKHEAIMHLKNLHLDRYVLGGGKCRNDGIYRYKKTFSKQGDVDFSIGCRVHDQNIYDKLCHRWQQRYPEKATQYGDYFLKYHY